MQHPVASAGVMWEDELQRVAQWLSSKKRQREQQQTAILARVNTHVQFVHAQKRDRELEAEEDDLLDEDNDDESAPEADLALDFLDGVNADDIKSLLEAEAARSSGVAAATMTESVAVSATAVATSAPESNMSMALIEMPSHLLAKNSPPKLYASPAKHVDLQPKFVVPSMRLPVSTAAASAKASVAAHEGSSQEEDAGVAELMNELDLDISDVAHPLPREAARHSDGHEEHKTEESTPPHFRKDRSKADQQTGSATSSAMEALAQSVFSSPVKANKTRKQKKNRNVVRDGSDESDEGDERSVERARSAQRPPVDPDAVGDEMRSWVSGYRDPEVIRRKESMSQRNRRPTARFGVNSVEEQRYINKAAKYYAEGKDVGSSDSESTAESLGSDFSPEEVEDQDDPVSDVELLSDDYLDREEAASTSSKAKPRRRLRNQHKDSKATKTAKSKQKSKKTRAVKGASSAPEPAPKSNNAGGNTGVRENGAKKNVGSFVPSSQAKPSSNASRETETIDLLSSDDGSDRRSDRGSKRAGVKRQSDKIPERIPNGSGAASHGQSRTAKEKEAMVLRLNLPKSMRESVTAAHSTRSRQPVSREAAHGVDALRQVQNAHAGSKTTDLREGVSEEVSKASVTERVQSTADSNADHDGDVSDAGTADLDEDMADQALDYEGTDEQDSTVANPAAVNADVSSPSEAATLIDKSLPALTNEDSSEALQVAEATLSLSEALLAQHNLLEISKTKPSEGQEHVGVNKDEESEAETIDFDDVEQESSNDEDFDFGGGESSRQEDLGFSDEDNEASDDTPAVVAPHDEDYVQFFEDTPLRKLKVAQKKELEQKQSEVSGVQSAHPKPSGSAASTLVSKTSSSTAKTPDPKPAAPVNGAKSMVAAVAKGLTGSNGLRKAVKPAAIATSAVLKGKFEHSRRSIKVIDDGVNNFERGKRSVSGVYAGNKPGVKKSRFSEPLVQHQENHSANRLTEEFISSISSPERRPSVDQWPSKSKNGNGASKSTRDEPDERYLSYGSKPNGTKSRSYDSDDEPLSVSARGSKSRSGDKDSRSAATTKNGLSSQPEKTWSFFSMVSSSNENVDSNPRAEKVSEFRRERQMDIYDALHIENQGENGLTSRDLRDGEYKRPSVFKKVQEEKEKRGIAFVPREKFQENAPIPKKKKVPAAQQQKPPVDDQRSNGSDKRSSPAKPASHQKESHYGPSIGEPYSAKKKNSSSSYDDRSSHVKYAPPKNSSSLSKKSKGRQSKNDKSKSRRSPSPVSRRRSNDSESYRFSSSQGSRFKEDDDRGRRREHSRSRSPLRKHDRYGSGSDAASRKQYRSLSRSRSRDRDERSSRLRNEAARDFRPRIDDRDRDRSHSSKDFRDSGSKREQSPPVGDRASSDPRKRARSLDRNDGRHSPLRNTEFEDPNPRDLKKAKPVDPRVATRKENTVRRGESNIVPPPPLGALDDSGSDMYISDSDGSENGDSKEADIRFDLEEVPVDQRQMRRRVYVSGINGMMNEGVLEELFEPFGIEVCDANRHRRWTGWHQINLCVCVELRRRTERAASRRSTCFSASDRTGPAATPA